MKPGSFIGRLFDSRGARWLGAALMAQLAIALTLVALDARDVRFVAPGPLLAFDAETVETIELADADNAVTLERTDSGWSVATDEGTDLPVDSAAVQAQLSRLSSLDGGLPVATSHGAQAQLDVAEDDFQRRIDLRSADETLATVFVGSSPGFRKAHVRLDDSDAIHAAELNTFDLPIGVDDWFDKSLLAVVGPTRISTDAWTLEKDGDAWVLADLAEDETADARAIQGVVDALSGLRVTALVANSVVDESVDQNAVAGDAGDEPQSIVLTINDSSGDHRLTLERREQTGVVSRDDIDARFELPVTTLDALMRDRKGLLEAPDA